jgi:hypothetical protein
MRNFASAVGLYFTKKGRGRPKIRLAKIVKKDMSIKEVTI